MRESYAEYKDVDRAVQNDDLLTYDLKAFDGDNEIVGGYRFHVCNHDSDPKNLATSKLLNFSDEFRKDYLPYMIELGTYELRN